VTWETFGIWIAALLTLVTYSFLYRDNPLYRSVESLFVGVSAGYGLAIIWRETFLGDLIAPILEGDEASRWYRLIPAALGALMLARFHPKTSYLSRWPMAFSIGLGAGMGIPLTIQANILKQAQGTMVSPVMLSKATNLECIVASASNIILVVGVLAVLSYFYFSKEHKGTYGWFCKVGIYILMFAFGASFGYTVMARISLFIGRVTFLLRDWLHFV